MILIDTRDKLDKIGHILDYFKRNKIPYDRTKLYIGDYQRADNGLILIDRKKNIQELAMNISEDISVKNDDEKRFRNELKRLDVIGGKMYILVEEKLNCLEDVQKWKSGCKKDGTPYTKLLGTTLYMYLLSYKRKHNIDFIFCHKNSTGRIIAELLNSAC